MSPHHDGCGRAYQFAPESKSPPAPLISCFGSFTNGLTQAAAFNQGFAGRNRLWGGRGRGRLSGSLRERRGGLRAAAEIQKKKRKMKKKKKGTPLFLRERRDRDSAVAPRVDRARLHYGLPDLFDLEMGPTPGGRAVQAAEIKFGRNSNYALRARSVGVGCGGFGAHWR